MFCSFAHVDRSRCFLRTSEARAITNHLTLIAAGEKRETFRVSRSFKSEKAIAVNSRVAGKHFFQFFAAHAFDRIAPKAFDFADHWHGGILYHEEHEGHDRGETRFMRSAGDGSARWAGINSKRGVNTGVSAP